MCPAVLSVGSPCLVVKMVELPAGCLFMYALTQITSWLDSCQNSARYDDGERSFLLLGFLFLLRSKVQKDVETT